MNAPTPEMRELFRRYLWDTASAAERARVEQLVAKQPELQQALDDERQRLRVLDVLPDQVPSHDLAADVERTIAQELTSERARRPLWKSFLPYAAAAAVVVLVIALLPALSRSREAARRASSQDNLKQLGLIMKMYVGESQGEQYPPLAPYDGVWMVDLRVLIPEFISDPTVLINPSDPRAGKFRDEMAELLAHAPVDWERVARIAAQSYVYPGWVVENPDDLPAFVHAVRRLAKADYGADIHVGDKTFLRQREGIERFLITDINNPAGSAAAQSEIPILFENVYLGETRQPAGINVLYMDGHVEFIKMGAKFPATDAAAQAFPPPPLD